MQNSEGTGRNPAPPEASGDSEKTSEVGPLGRTRSEDQRRRLIVAGLSTPALMTLPSRRVWAVKCSKSKLMSGNLSAKKKTGDLTYDCEPMGCGRSFWASNDGALFDGGVWMGESFSTWFPGDCFTNPSCGSVVDASDGDWDSLLTPAAQVAFGAADPLPPYSDKYKDDAAKAFIKAARELAACWLNDQYIRWPVPNDRFNFEKNIGFPAAGLRDDCWSLPGVWLSPSTKPTQSTQHKTAIYNLARDAGHWASEYLKYKAIEKSLPSGAAKDEAKAEKEAAEGLFKAAEDFLKEWETEIKAMNELHCPFA